MYDPPMWLRCVLVVDVRDTVDLTCWQETQGCVRPSDGATLCPVC